MAGSSEAQREGSIHCCRFFGLLQFLLDGKEGNGQLKTAILFSLRVSIWKANSIIKASFRNQAAPFLSIPAAAAAVAGETQVYLCTVTLFLSRGPTILRRMVQQMSHPWAGTPLTDGRQHRKHDSVGKHLTKIPGRNLSQLRKNT